MVLASCPITFALFAGFVVWDLNITQHMNIRELHGFLAKETSQQDILAMRLCCQQNGKATDVIDLSFEVPFMLFKVNRSIFILYRSKYHRITPKVIHFGL